MAEIAYSRATRGASPLPGRNWSRPRAGVRTPKAGAGWGHGRRSMTHQATMRALLCVALLGSAALTSRARNLAANPGFVTDLSGWTVLSAPSFADAHDPSQSCSTPGALRATTSGAGPPGDFAVGRQCLPVTPGPTLDFGAKYRFESGHAIGLEGYALTVWFTDTGCTTGASSDVTTHEVADVAGTWLPIHAANVVVPSGARSAFFSPRHQDRRRGSRLVRRRVLRPCALGHRADVVRRRTSCPGRVHVS